VADPSAIKVVDTPFTARSAGGTRSRALPVTAIDSSNAVIVPIGTTIDEKAVIDTKSAEATNEATVTTRTRAETEVSRSLPTS